MTIDRDQLLESAKKHATKTLQAYTDDDHEAALTEAAVSLEQLSKAVLCDLHPALLIELRNGQLDSLLHLVGHGDKAKKPAKDLRTISGALAITRIKEILPHIKVPQERINQLIALRNGALHAGVFEGGETQVILAAFVRLSDRLFEELQVDRADRWGGNSQLAEALVSETLSDVEKSVRARMTKALRTYEEWVAKTPRELRSAWMETLQVTAYNSFVRSQPPPSDIADMTCPVCSHERATCIGDVRLATVFDGDGSYQMWILVAHSFICGVCDLRLRDLDELHAAGVPEVVELPDYEPDPSEYMDEGPWTVD
ncbi:hypothetical protein [Actinomadura monticuli]|uniref:DUF4145 domain-containing protein n=1 Tax=Actinomadura monticuli TaxID=3097367 RepID=A0ABV4Q697_9ACTN